MLKISFFKLSLEGNAKPAQFYRYLYSETERDRGDVKLNPQAEFPALGGVAEWQGSLPRNSLTIYSTYKLAHDAPGVIVE